MTILEKADEIKKISEDIAMEKGVSIQEAFFIAIKEFERGNKDVN